MKVLVICFSSPSEIIQSSPVVRILKSQLQHTVHFATLKKNHPYLEANPYLDGIHTLEDSFTDFVRDLKAEKFDILIDLQSDFKSWMIKFKLRCKSYSIAKNRFRSWLLVNFKINLIPQNHYVSRIMETLLAIGGKIDNLGLDYFIPERDEVEDNWLPVEFKNGFATLVLSAEHKTRQLPKDRLIELCDRINKPIVLVGNKEDEKIGNRIEEFFRPGSVSSEKEIESLNKKTIIFNACGKFSINQSASLISKANWVFTHDHFLMHIAAAFKKPIFSIWGSTVPEFGKYPFRTQFTIFENKTLNCRPCSSTGFEKCPKGHFKCMKDLIFDFYLPD